MADFWRRFQLQSISFFLFFSFQGVLLFQYVTQQFFRGGTPVKKKKKKRRMKKYDEIKGIIYIVCWQKKKKQFFNVISSMFPYNFVAFLFSMAAFCRHRVKIATEI